MGSTRVLTTTPAQYKSTVASRDNEELLQDVTVFRAYLSRLADCRQAGRRMESVGAGWTGRDLNEAIALALEAIDTEPGIVPVYRDGGLVFVQGREGLEPDFVRILFEKCDALRFEGAARDAAGQGMVPTGNHSLAEWWKRGYGSPQLREFLAAYADSEATEEDVDRWEFAPLWANVSNIGVIIGPEHVDEVSGSNRYALLDDAAQPSSIIATFETDDEQVARTQAIAAVNGERHCIALAQFIGTATLEEIAGVDVYRGITTYNLRCECDSRAAAALLERAVESFAAPRCGKILRVHENENGAMSWDVVVIEAGLGYNDSFYLRDLLKDKLADAMNGRPVEEIFIDTKNLGHLPDDVFVQYPNGVTGVVVGQLTDVRFDDEGGMLPDPEIVNAVAEHLKMTTAEVIEQAKGRVIATLEFDNNTRGRDAHAMVQGSFDRGLLDEHPQLSVDFNEAPFVAFWHKGREIAVRHDVNDLKRMTISMVNKGAQGGRFLDRKAA